MNGLTCKQAEQKPSEYDRKNEALCDLDYDLALENLRSKTNGILSIRPNENRISNCGWAEALSNMERLQDWNCCTGIRVSMNFYEPRSSISPKSDLHQSSTTTRM